MTTRYRLASIARGAAASAVALVCAASTVACAAPLPAAHHAAASPPPASPSASPSAPAGTRVWSAAAGEHATVAASSAGWVIASEHTVTGLGHHGAARWRRTWHVPCSSDLSCEDRIKVTVAGSVVVVAHDDPGRQDWPERLIVQALDAASGTLLWTDRRSSFVSVLRGVVYTSVCDGAQHHHLGDCDLSARDPRSGTTRWTTAAYASAQVVDATSAYLVEYSYPTGDASQTITTLDPHTGATLGVSVRADWAIPTTTALVTVTSTYHGATRCTNSLTGRQPRGGGVVWHRTITSINAMSAQCLDTGGVVGAGQVAVVNRAGATVLVDLATGHIDWTASQPGNPVWIGRRYVLVAAANDDLVCYQRASGAVRWRTEKPNTDPSYQPDWGVAPVGRWLAVFDHAADDWCYSHSGCPTTDVVDPGTGALYRQPKGVYVTVTEGVLITKTDNADDHSGQTTHYHAYTIR